jgi:hypothetical protein
LAFIAIVSACGTREASIGDATPRTKNLASSKNSIDPKKSPLAAQSSGLCSPLGAIHRSKPVIVAPPESNSAEQSFSGGDCSFVDTYSSRPGVFIEPGTYTFTWSPTKKVGAVIVEISRDGIVWKSLRTMSSSATPNAAEANITSPGRFYVRVRPADVSADAKG